MSLASSVGKVLDKAVSTIPSLGPFVKQKSPDGQDLRTYLFRAATYSQEIIFYLDKWWEKEKGGTLYAELSHCLNAPQLRVSYTLSTFKPKREWLVRQPFVAARFEEDIRHWLVTVAEPWLAQLSTPDGLVAYLWATESYIMLAELLAVHSRVDEAREAMRCWLLSLPRQTDRILPGLEKVGLLSSADSAYLALASIQHEDEYRARVDTWLRRT